MKSIKPPTLFTRQPRSIAEHWNHFKGFFFPHFFCFSFLFIFFSSSKLASELRDWMLYYSLPLLHNILPEVYFYHWSTFVCAMWILLSPKITIEQLNFAEVLLQCFEELFKELYGIYIYLYLYFFEKKKLLITIMNQKVLKIVQ